MTPIEVRSQLVEALSLDLVGPGHEEDDAELREEVLSQDPSRWYLTGFLVPTGAAESQRSDETADDDFTLTGGDSDAADDAAVPDPPAARRAYFPSSIGVSLLVPAGCSRLTVTARWGDYQVDPIDEPKEGDATPPQDGDPPTPATPGRGRYHWRRVPREETLTLSLPKSSSRPLERDVPHGDGLKIALSVRPVKALGIAEGMVPEGARSVSLFLVNHRSPAPDEVRDARFAFQAELEVLSDEPLIPRPNVRGHATDEWDERVADLQFRDVYEYAVGHNISTHAYLDATGHCRRVHTCWIPSAQVERVAPAPIERVELGMEALAALSDGGQVKERLGGLVSGYRDWIEGQRTVLPTLTAKRREIAEQLLERAGQAANRIEAGIDLLTDERALNAFRLANRVMATSARRRFGTMEGKDPASIDPPGWRPFQLAFILMNLPGVADPLHYDRKVVDLLFFPTGGGKTEAYLGLAAFTLVYRRLTHPGIASAGLSVLMRYTLRLLTLDQLGRASTLICALELERQQAPDTLGPWPFEIGLWVGRAATPNRMGDKKDPDPNCAYRKTIAYQNDDRKPSPIPLENCPWCGEKFRPASFLLLPNKDRPTDLRVLCLNRDCDFRRNNPLPILTVDEPIYRRLPCFLIATVDKFAAMPWTGPVGAFFGRVDRHDPHGFYGPCERDVGRSLPGPLAPPDLIIQDELHLISGPMGTMVGLYESALDELCSRMIDGKKVRPKVIASTATVRRAESQIRSLFNRREVDVFPPPGPDRRDSYFARTHTTAESHPRLYLGVAAQGRSLKVIMLRAYLALLGAGQKAYTADGGKRNHANAADPYMTLLGYFNSLRELGGSRRIIEDEVTLRLRSYAARKRVGQADSPFADRDISYEVVELTSRVNTSRVADAKRRLALRFREDERVDVAIATNMISVGLDITRLGLMAVLGQPKTTAEYIQATSRVGRDEGRPGLVVTLLNVHRHRDRSHYERFEVFHESFYRTVEATSVTPFSPRALDRGLAGTLVALARLGDEQLTPPRGAGDMLSRRQPLEWVAKVLSDRAGEASVHVGDDPQAAESLRQHVKGRAHDLLDAWEQIAHDYRRDGTTLQYNPSEVGAAKPLLHPFLDPELKLLAPRHMKFRANRSMRDVEPSVNFWLRTLDDREIETEEGQP